MKKMFTMIASVLLTVCVFAQAPEKISYQAVIRDNGILVTNQMIGIQIKILQYTTTGLAVFGETHTPTTNDDGLATLEIGNGVPISGLGAIADIDWDDGPYYLENSTDPTGGTNYTITGTSQLLSVPYALYAKNAAGVTGHYIGEVYGGGIVFFVYDNGQHGLIAATVDQSTGIRWYGGSYTYTQARADGVNGGLKNTAEIIGGQGPVDGGAFAATVCNEYSVWDNGVYYGDWYLPSIHELNLLYAEQVLVGGFSGSYYWSSTECPPPPGQGLGTAWIQRFSDGAMDCADKSSLYYVRAVRAF